ncbi:MAG: hypothetical protein GY940_11025 [bacterium]|nr:hypothetical protein [bacterium]
MGNRKTTVRISNLIDWSRSFVDENGSFYCGTTPDQKKNAAAIVSFADLVINNMDLHPVTAPEHAVNGGLYPVHNAAKPWEYNGDFIYMKAAEGEELRLEDKTLSPELTGIIAEAAASRKGGVIAPRGVYFQGENNSAFCSPGDIEETFRFRIITKEDFLEGEYDYITAPKQYFDATRIDSDISLPQDEVEGIPQTNFNIYSLLKKKFPSDRYRLVFINTGVVEGICRLHTSIGMRQMFPFDRIINISNATTPLYGIGLGYDTADQSRQASTRVCKDIGIEYMTTEECVKEFG